MVEQLRETDGILRDEILKQIPTPVMAVNTDMDIIYVNDQCCKLLASSEDQILGKKCYDVFKSDDCKNGECCMRKSIKDGQMCSKRNNISINQTTLPIEYFTVPLKNSEGDLIGGLEYILDISERVAYENKLKEQSYTIQEMSTPTIKLWEGILLLPIVGVVDSMRAQHMMESILKRIASTYSKVIILDIHGVAAVDTAVANHLIRITKATKLMGCDCILSGISPSVAQTIIQLGIDMNNIMTKSTLSDALEEAYGMLHLRVEGKGDR